MYRSILVGLATLTLAGCDAEQIERPEPGPLQVGTARVRLPVPVGIGTAGFGGFGVEAEPSPFADIYPATTRAHLHPDFEVVVVSRGDGFEVVLLRSPTVAIFQQLRRAVVLELRERLGKDLDDELILGATHTHAGPGRVVDGGGVYDLLADRFLPEFYERVVDSMADAVEAAYADLAPGRIGYTIGYAAEGHSDRRCDDGLDYTNGTVPVLAVEQEGELVAVALAYAVHGVAIGIDELTLSQDVGGGIERQVEDGFDHPVMVQFFNSWAADMSPTSPDVPLQESAPLPSGHERIQRVGRHLADEVHLALEDLVWMDDPEVHARTYRVPLDRDALGYADGEFPYEYGATFCGGSLTEDCDPDTIVEDLDQTCGPFPEEYPAPVQTLFTVGNLGDLSLVTWPGEPGTLLAEQVVDGIAELSGGEVMFLGYSQDFNGYSILEDDWWQGGYEAGGALWGPLQGEYLADQAVEAYRKLVQPGSPADSHLYDVAPVQPFGDPTYTPYQPPTATDPGAVIEQVSASYGPTDEVVFVVSGSDPWLGTPLAFLELEDGTAVLRPGGQPIDSDGLGFWVELSTDPTYRADMGATERAFHWHFHLAPRPRVVGAHARLEGRYRLRVEVPVAEGDPLQVTSDVFEVAGS